MKSASSRSRWVCTIDGSMRFSDLRVLRRPGWRAGLAAALIFASVAAQAHKSSDSYLQLDVGSNGLSVRWDIALRDLDVALDLDTNADGKLSWGEVKAALPRIESYSMA